MTIVMSLSSCGRHQEAQAIIEEAYFEGQKDALSGDVRISKTREGCWIWTKSPWDNGTSPIFNPAIVCSKDEHKIQLKAQIKF